MAKKTVTEKEASFETHYNELQLLVQQIEDDATPLEKLPKLIEAANAILENLQNKLRNIDQEINLNINKN